MQPNTTRLIRPLGTALLAGLFQIALSHPVMAQTTRLNISTDIAPVHSLVSMVVGENSDVDLIVPPMQSPHSFSLKPSQIRALHKADLIVIVSEGFSPSLSRHITTVDKEDNIVLDLSAHLESSDSTNATVEVHAEDEHHEDAEHDKHAHSDHASGENHEEHEEHEQHAEHEEHTDHIDHGDHLAHDEHTWLNPENAIIWLAEIAEALASIDETNRALYEQNASLAIAELNALNDTVAEQLKDVKEVPYIVYHDAYQHFAHAYGLAEPQPIALSDARAPGAAKISAIRDAGKQSQCIFAEVQHDDAIVDTISDGLTIKRGTLDPIGSSLTIGPTLYPDLIAQLSQSFYDCLSN